MSFHLELYQEVGILEKCSTHLLQPTFVAVTFMAILHIGVGILTIL